MVSESLIHDGQQADVTATEIEDSTNADTEFEIISFKTVEEIEKSIVESPFRAIYQINNFLIPQIKDVVDESRTINLRPEYQRRARWTRREKSLLIESFLLNIPVPPIFLFEADFARYEVMDGQQRLLAIKEFITNQFKLSSLVVLSPLNGLTYASLPSRTKRTLERASLSAIVLLKESRASLRDANSKRVLELRKFVFERLNTGGKRLNAQELRNAVYSGKFNDSIIAMARSPLFTQIWSIPPYSSEYDDNDYESPERKKNNLYKTMGDCQIVLRFFALRDSTFVRGSMRSILDRCMEKNLEIDKQASERMAKDYRDRLSLANTLFDERPFQLEKQGRPSESMYDAVMFAVDKLWSKRDELVRRRIRIQDTYWSAIDTPEKVERFSGRANTAEDVKQRMSAMRKLFETALRDG